MGSMQTASTVRIELGSGELAIAQWAAKHTRSTFEEVVRRGHLKRMPPMPSFEGPVLVLPAVIDTLEEMDYQLTVGLRDNPDSESVGFDLAMAAGVSRKMWAALPRGMRLSA